MIFNLNGPEDSYPKTIYELDEHTINNVKMFKYLGANIHYKDAATGDAETPLKRNFMSIVRS